MIVQITNIATLLALVLFSTFGVLATLPGVATAATPTPDPASYGQTCPIFGGVSAQLAPGRDSYEVADQFNEDLIVRNTSSFALAGVRVGLALYDATSDTKPAYWAVIPQTYTLSPGEITSVSTELSLASVPAGTYTIKTFASQGDEAELLGEIMLLATTSSQTVVKSTPRSQKISVAINAPSELPAGSVEPSEFLIKTTNGSDQVLVESRMLGVITYGTVGLGTAVRSSVLDSVLLVPGHSRTTELFEQLPYNGQYTIYGALITEGAFQPVSTQTIVVGGVEENSASWPYIAAVGVSEYPLTPQSEIIVCVNRYGASGVDHRFGELLGFDVALSQDGKTMATTKLLSDESETLNYVRYQPGVSLVDYELSIGVMQRVQNIIRPEDTSIGEREQKLQNLTLVDTLTQQFVCGGELDCNVEENTAVQKPLQKALPSPQESFWYYASIVIAAALLMYLMLGRLGGKKDIPTKITNDELQ